MTEFKKDDGVRFCPQCGSPSVDFSQLVGSVAQCRACDWQGRSDSLLIVPLKHDFVNGEEALVRMMGDLRSLLAGEVGVPYLRFLLKWGFVKADQQNIAGTLDRKMFSRYLAVIGQAIIKALLEERVKIDLEEHNGAAR